MTDISVAAVAFAKAGKAVFPLQPRQKKPYGRTPGLHGASADPEVVASWWAGSLALPLKPPPVPQGPVYAKTTSNVAMRTGAINGLWVFDIDGDSGEAGLKALTDVHGELPETPEQRTGGGRQLFFEWDDRYEVKNSVSKLGLNVDVRGTGGYVLVPPSVHPGDAEKGIPPGRIYTWCARRALGEIPLAKAPTWLLDLVAPPEPPKSAPRPLNRTIRDGRASKWGEATLATVCRQVATATPGNRRMAVFKYAAFLGGLVAGNEVERSYAKESLVQAGLSQAVDKAWRQKDLEQLIENGLLKGEPHPQTAPERRTFEPAAPHQVESKATPAEVACDIRDARSLWTTARGADCVSFRTWLKMRGLDPAALPNVMTRLRAHVGAPLGASKVGPGLLIPLTTSAAEACPDEIEALAVLPLFEGADRPTHFVGAAEGKVARLSAWPDDGSLLIALDLRDLWALGSNAAENEHDLGLVLAPKLRTFAGGYLGDRYGRADPLTPHADPEDAPWTAPGARAVYAAIRNDLRTPELRTRRTFGGTRREAVQGDAAARFYGGLLEQAWRRSGATKVHLMRPSNGVGFSGGRV